MTARFVSLAGDLDLVVGEWDGMLTYIENTGTSTAPVFVQRTGSANPFDGIEVGWYSAPALGDFDNDGTPEALVLGNERYRGDLSFSYGPTSEMSPGPQKLKPLDLKNVRTFCPSTVAASN